ncbi:hypothetical protein GRX03_15980 [Halovenus sp. WSH3]|uniref:Lipoprotein n=1 Tax=Halovenus carboxidivorans TaxID=2692199 RepID=A0A6B0T829_9EURY|nr:hypothetical protein [Halovenus carboxidivorans]MXR53097.1 hypothetical protein [Halovenus carboxidivorans]
MKRRFVLAGLAAHVAITGGCVSAEFGGDEEPPRPTEITGYDYETGVDTSVEMPDGPVITADRERAAVSVKGVAPYGSARCGYLDGHAPSYDADESKLSISVTAEQDRSGERPCEDDMGGDSYRFVVWFDRGVPAVVDAREPFETQATEEF